MSDRHETIADIIAEMRGMGNYQRYSGDHARVLANRLEAAHKRERGNAAKLREAVAKCVNLITEFGNAEIVMTPLDVIVDIEAILKIALSAPPRNCDIAQDWLRDLYVNFKPPASVKREMPPEWVDSVMAFCRWLLAPATEKKGGDK